METIELCTSTSARRHSRKDFRQPRAKPRQSCTSYAIWLLSRHEYSAAKLRQKLVERGYSEEEAAATLDVVVTNGYQSDQRYAGLKARSYERRAGNMKIAVALKQKGIAKELVQEQLHALAPEGERAIAAVVKFRMKAEANGLDQTLRQKIIRFLSNRGFSFNAIKAALNSFS